MLYKLPQVARAVREGHAVWLVEGEKDADTLSRFGICATTGGGAGFWHDSFTESLRNGHIVVVPDADEAGRKHAEKVCAALHGAVKSLRVIEAPSGKDVSEFIESGGAIGDLVARAEAAPLWEPTQKSESTGTVRLTHSVEPSSDDTADLRGELLRILGNKALGSTQKASEIASTVVSALTRRGRLYYHDGRRDFDSAMYFDSQRKRLERIRSDAFRAWLSEWTALNSASNPFKYVAAAVETAALSSEFTTGIVPEAFFASRNGAVYLSSGDGRMVRVTADGIDVVDNGTDGVLFSAGRTMSPWSLTEPRDAFETCSLFSGVNCAAEHGAMLLQLWTYSLPTNPRTKPPLCLTGDVGSGKTRTAKGLAELLGFQFIAQKVEESGEDDFWPAMDAGGLVTLDNADTRCRWLPDAVAAAATDGCSQRRKLYTNSETVVLRARAWLAITSASPSFASDAGLADRLLVVRLNRREGSTGDAALSDEIDAARDAGLSHIAATLRAALADTDPVPAGLNQRHPDWGEFAVRIGRALGREHEAIAAVRAAERDKACFCLENDVVAAALLSLVRSSGTFEGSAAELGPRLVSIDPELEGRVTPRRLGKKLAALWPHLQSALGARQEKDRNHIIRYRFTPPSAGCAGFEELVLQKSLANRSHETFPECGGRNPANPADTPGEPEDQPELVPFESLPPATHNPPL